MKILLDTCSFLWLVTEDKKRLNSKAIDAFLDEGNEIYFSIPFHHKDPFDRLLIAQAITEDMS